MELSNQFFDFDRFSHPGDYNLKSSHDADELPFEFPLVEVTWRSVTWRGFNDTIWESMMLVEGTCAVRNTCCGAVTYLLCTVLLSFQVVCFLMYIIPQIISSAMLSLDRI